ncbi:FAD-dependent oxidoreductase [Halorarius litoreus]|uniref:FAD-dependent oxidoreductase n=1 Tax=Halorarius litoreus TaxID=2962676 RepID=UPI0020CEDB38|nr:FAD-dependent oxidoreductase [Halorarius litoreus]
MDTDVAIVGGGVAGLTAATFTARAGLDTLVIDHGESILARNAHLENVPGFPLGINARTFLSLLREQAAENGVEFHEARVTRVSETDDGLRLRAEVSDGETDITTSYALATSWSDSGYLDELADVGLTKRGSKVYVDVDDFGRTGVDGLYAAGRIAEKPHQTVVAAGHGAEVALTLIDDSDVPFYHDWVAPEGYFTGRGREVPPGCEEISDEERREREQASLDRLQEAFAEPQSEPPTMHPSVADDTDDAED